MDSSGSREVWEPWQSPSAWEGCYDWDTEILSWAWVAHDGRVVWGGVVMSGHWFGSDAGHDWREVPANRLLPPSPAVLWQCQRCCQVRWVVQGVKPRRTETG